MFTSNKFYGTGTIVTKARSVAEVRERAAAFEMLFDKPADVWVSDGTFIDTLSGDLVFASNGAIKVAKIGRKYLTLDLGVEGIAIVAPYASTLGAVEVVDPFTVELSARV